MTDLSSTTPNTAPAPAGEAPINASPDFTPGQLAAMADDLVARGRLTREQADEALKADGVELPPAPKPGSPEAIEAQRVAELDATLPRAQPHEYEMPSYLEHASIQDPRAPLPPETRALDQAARGWLHEARFPKGSGSFVAKEVERAATTTANMSEAEFKLYAATERTKLERMWKGDYNRKLALVQKLVAEMEERRPGVTEMLKLSGAGSTATVLAKLADQAEFLLDRAGGK